MRVDLRTLEPNPMRDFAVDPIDPEVVEKLRQSIAEDGFWGGVVCRRLPDGTIQTGAGHHRVEAAIAAGITTADLYVADGLDDSDMVRIYTRENATQRGNSGTALAGSVAAALRLLAKAMLTDNLSRILERLSERGEQVAVGTLTSGHGIGEPLLTRYFHEQGVHGMGEYTVRQQLANLKASGAYARIMTEVQEEIEREREEARQQAEQERLELERKTAAAREAERKRQQAEAEERRAQDEQRAATARKRAAREERERAEAEERRRKAEEDAARAALMKKEADALAESLERQKQELEAQMRSREAEQRRQDAAATRAQQAAGKAQRDAKRVFDFEGVSKHLRNPFQISTFRDVVTGQGVTPYVRLEDQEALAARIVEAARRAGRRGEQISAEFIREHIDAEVWALRQADEAVSREDERQRVHESYVHQARRYQHEIARHFVGIASVGRQLRDLHQEWPQDLSFPVSGEFLDALNTAKAMIDALVERMGR